MRFEKDLHGIGGFTLAWYSVLISLLLCWLQPAWSNSMDLGTREVLQPDGTRIAVREFGDEFGRYLAVKEGYVVQDTSTGYYHYARYDTAGHATPSSLRVGRDDGTSEVWRLALENEATLADRARKYREMGPDGRVLRSSHGVLPTALLVLLVEFSDVKHQNPEDWPMAGLPADAERDKSDYPEYTVSDFETMLFGDSYTGERASPDGEAVYGSMRQYWLDMSKGGYTLTGRVVNKRDNGVPEWIELSGSKASYSAGTFPAFRDSAVAAARREGQRFSECHERGVHHLRWKCLCWTFR